MNLKIFNVCLLLGWLMVLAGGVVINPGWGIALAGALMIALVLASAYIGGLYAPKPEAAAGEGKAG